MGSMICSHPQASACTNSVGPTPSHPMNTTPQKAPAPGSTDHLEMRAAEIAKRNGNQHVTDEDRKAAYSELRTTAPPVAKGEPVSH